MRSIHPLWALLIVASIGALIGAPRPALGAAQAVLFLSPASGTFLVGSTFDLSVLLDTKSTAINAVEVELLFPPELLQIASPSVGRSLVEVWPSPPVFSNREGKIYFVGGIPSPGLVTTRGVILTLTFRVIAPGEAGVEFGQRSRVFANDGRGTEVLGQRSPAYFRLNVPPPLGPAISSPTHPDQERWYRDPNPSFVWAKSDFTQVYSYSFDNDPSGFPDTIADSKIPTTAYQDVGSGVWYFHLREQRSGVWGGVSHYALKIDREPPAGFKVEVSPGIRTTARNPVLRFFSTDALSGLDHFEMKMVPLAGEGASEALFFEVSSPYQAPKLEPGRYQVVVRALDGAGNARDAALTLTILHSFGQYLNPEGIDFGFMLLSWPILIAVLTALLALVLAILGAVWATHHPHVLRALRQDARAISRLLRVVRGKMIIWIVLVILGSALGLSAYSAQSLSSPSAPVISVAPARYYPLDEFLYLEGRSHPTAPVDILFERVGGGAQPLRKNVQANSLGEWYVAERLELASGEWVIRARVATDPPSDWSAPRLVRSLVSGFAVGPLRVRYVPVALSLVGLFIASGILLGWSVFKVRRISQQARERALEEKAEELEEKLRQREREGLRAAVEEKFSEIRKSVSEELVHLESRRREYGGLPPEEEAHRAALLKELREAEEKIEEKIS